MIDACCIHSSIAISGVAGQKLIRRRGVIAIIFFTARRYASAVYAVVVCLSVRLPSDRPYVTSRCSTNKTARRRVMQTTPKIAHGLYRLILHSGRRKFGHLQNKGTSLWNFSPNSGLVKISPRLVDRRKCNQQSTDDSG